MSSRARLIIPDGWQPPPPVNVRLVFPDMTVPVDCTYVGFDQDARSHLWAANNPRPRELPSEILVDKLPSHTSVTVAGGSDG